MVTFNNLRTTINTARNRPETERGKETSKRRDKQETRSREETSKKLRSQGIVTWPSAESIEVEVKAISWNK